MQAPFQATSHSCLTMSQTLSTHSCQREISSRLRSSHRLGLRVSWCSQLSLRRDQGRIRPGNLLRVQEGKLRNHRYLLPQLKEDLVGITNLRVHNLSNSQVFHLVPLKKPVRIHTNH